MMNIETCNRCIDLQLDELDELFDEIKSDAREDVDGLDMKAVFQHVDDRYEIIGLLRAKKEQLELEAKAPAARKRHK